MCQGRGEALGAIVSSGWSSVATVKVLLDEHAPAIAVILQYFSIVMTAGEEAALHTNSGSTKQLILSIIKFPSEGKSQHPTFCTQNQNLNSRVHCKWELDFRDRLQYRPGLNAGYAHWNTTTEPLWLITWTEFRPIPALINPKTKLKLNQKPRKKFYMSELNLDLFLPW